MASVFERIKKFNENRLPDMVQLKMKAMADSPFRFFRGTCHLFYEDLSSVKKFPASPQTWICGDLHLENFGSFKGNNRMEYFDLNDFDESILAPCAWEVVRMLTSIYVGLSSPQVKQNDIDELAELFVNQYAETLKIGKARYIDPRTATGIVHKFLKNIKKRKEKDLISKLAYTEKGGYAIKINNLTHFKIERDLKKELKQSLNAWLNKTDRLNDYKVKDAAFRVAGTGSVGCKRYMFMLQDDQIKNKFIFVELKEAMQSSLSPYVKAKQPSWPSQADRVIGVKKRMQNVSPALLSTFNFKGINYVLQEMQPMADKVNFENIAGNRKDLRSVLTDMATLTASAQLRSGGIQGSAIIDELTAFGNEIDWQSALKLYAKNYAQQVVKDYEAYVVDYKQSLLDI
ncbi:DUF2252 domain-containing protein [Mucilaginibacter flavus]|uniref:DUF2252 domain-containing protein n=1 Tax=Mucilaginibacter flavus TaxID=931504 RepID=UPI0025B5D59F|nr:DUF2252 family protein [Mucilaginibacter flavus]MDN3581452.1 DUF2252 family protein [Mucilaginibacter flavus]